MDKPTLENFNELVKTEEGIKALFAYLSNVESRNHQLNIELKYFKDLVERLNLDLKVQKRKL